MTYESRGGMGFKPTTRPGRRVYRGAPKPLAPGACPHCGRLIGTTSRNRRRAHHDETGARCTGSGIPIGAPVVVMPLDPSLAEFAPCVPPVEKYEGRSDRYNIERGACPQCGRHIPFNGDGSLRGHRTRHQDPFAPRCSGGAS